MSNRDEEIHPAGVIVILGAIAALFIWIGIDGVRNPAPPIPAPLFTPGDIVRFTAKGPDMKVTKVRWKNQWRVHVTWFDGNGTEMKSKYWEEYLEKAD